MTIYKSVTLFRVLVWKSDYQSKGSVGADGYATRNEAERAATTLLQAGAKSVKVENYEETAIP